MEAPNFIGEQPMNDQPANEWKQYLMWATALVIISFAFFYITFYFRISEIQSELQSSINDIDIKETVNKYMDENLEQISPIITAGYDTGIEIGNSVGRETQISQINKAIQESIERDGYITFDGNNYYPRELETEVSE